MPCIYRSYRTFTFTFSLLYVPSHNPIDHLLLPYFNLLTPSINHRPAKFQMRFYPLSLPPPEAHIHTPLFHSPVRSHHRETYAMRRRSSDLTSKTPMLGNFETPKTQNPKPKISLFCPPYSPNAFPPSHTLPIYIISAPLTPSLPTLNQRERIYFTK